MEPPKLTTEQRLDGYRAFIEGEPYQLWNGIAWNETSAEVVYITPNTIVRRKPTPQSPLDGLRALARQWEREAENQLETEFMQNLVKNCAAQLEATLAVIETDHPELHPK